MTRILSTCSKVLVAGAAALMMGGISGCYGEVDEGPPPEYVSSTAPVYYEGRPAYWYGNRWYYRDGGRWGYYRTEPRYLREYRARPGVRVGRPERREEHERR